MLGFVTSDPLPSKLFIADGGVVIQPIVAVAPD